MKRAILSLALMALWPGPLTHAQTDVTVGVLSLFHPQELMLQQDGFEVISIAAGGVKEVLNGEADHAGILFHAERDRVIVNGKSASSWMATGRGGDAVAFRLIVPNKFKRGYRGRLTVTAHDGELVAIVSMDRETAVASIVASELSERAPIEALKAQAVAARSFLSAGRRHKEYEFCDTTHCQYLRSPPQGDSRVWRAVEATRGMVLVYGGKPLAAMYSSRCGGHTRTLRDVGMEPGGGYPYYSVRCAYCLRHSVQWQSWIADEAGSAPTSGNERRRIEQARQWGWGTVPGSDFIKVRDGAGWRLEGHSIGHGIGMCQFGAVGMAAAGASFREILQHYYPNTEIAGPS